MIINRELDYALRIVRALSKKDQMTASDIESSEKIPVAFVRKIVRKLKFAGIVNITRGPQGGYSLIKPTDELNIWKISEAIGDQIFVNECLKDGYSCKLNNCNACFVHKECMRIQNVLIAEMSKNSLTKVFNS